MVSHAATADAAADAASAAGAGADSAVHRRRSVWPGIGIGGGSATEPRIVRRPAPQRSCQLARLARRAVSTPPARTAGACAGGYAVGGGGGGGGTDVAGPPAAHALSTPPARPALAASTSAADVVAVLRQLSAAAASAPARARSAAAGRQLHGRRRRRWPGLRRRWRRTQQHREPRLGRWRRWRRPPPLICRLTLRRHARGNSARRGRGCPAIAGLAGRRPAGVGGGAARTVTRTAAGVRLRPARGWWVATAGAAAAPPRRN